MSVRTRRFGGLALAAAAILALGTACGGDDPVGPEPGTLEVRLATPYSDDGALVVRITGRPLDPDADPGPVAAVDPDVYLHTVESGAGVTAVLVGDLAPGALLRFTVPDIGAVTDYAATVLQAADRSSALRESVDGYGLTVVPVGGS